MKTRLTTLTNRLLLLALAGTAFLFQNCGQFTALSSQLSSVADSSSPWITAGGGTLRPSTDKIDAACATSSKYDACLFLKNPVAAKNSSFSGTVSTSPTLDSVQTYGVKLVNRTGSGLSNSTFSVESVQGTKVSVGSSNLKLQARADSQRLIAQTMAYYWINRTQDYLTERTGLSPARGRAIRVVADDTVAGWSPDTNSLHLRISDVGEVMGLSGDLAIHFFGQANLHYASNGAIRKNPATQHKTCGLKTYGCCLDSVGCSRAIASGVGDYFVAMLFPDQPTVGESWANRTQGLGFCNLSRDLNEARSRTAQTAYDACAASGIAGETSTMGTIYASIWWQIRKNAEIVKPGTGAIEIDTLFMRHLSVLTGEDTFATGIAKVIQMDQSLYQGRYSALFRAELKARGL